MSIKKRGIERDFERKLNIFRQSFLNVLQEIDKLSVKDIIQIFEIVETDKYSDDEIYSIIQKLEKKYCGRKERK